MSFMKFPELHEDLDILKFYNLIGRYNPNELLNMINELNPTIDTLVGLSKFLKAESRDKNSVSYEKATEYFENFYRNSLVFKKIIDNTLDLNKLESCCFTLNLSNINLVSSVKNVVDSFENAIKSKEVSLEFINHMDKSFIACDEEKLQKIVFNLIYNSVKYTNKNDKIIISIKEKDNKIYICVEDTGVGIPSDELPKVFNKFFQGSISISEMDRGMGAGLFIVNKFVKILDGKIYIYSKPNKGTKIMIELPFFLLEKPCKKLVAI